MLGIGTADSWDDEVSGMDWAGSEVAALLGDGSGTVDDDLVHINEGTTGQVFGIGDGAVEGATQEVVMDPTILVGTRKYLTAVDMAFLRDIGWQTVPEPSSLVLLGAGALAVLARRRRSA